MVSTRPTIGRFLLLALVGLGCERGPSTELVGELGADGKPVRSVVMLDARDSARNPIHVYEPRDGVRVTADALPDVIFRWSRVEGADRYLFLINDEIGSLIWRSSVKDTQVVLPDKIAQSVTPGDRVKWIVQAAELSASTDLQRLEILSTPEPAPAN